MEILNKFDLEKIINLIKNNKIVALPTDTIYGFSCLATDNKSIEKLCKIKHREDSQQFILLVSESYDLNNLIDVSDKNIKFIKENTPNPITMIVNKNKNVNLSTYFKLPTLAIRIPKDKFLQSILSEVGIMISTSCNIHGQIPLNDYKEIVKTFDTLDGVVKIENYIPSKPSTIVDLSQQEIKIIRQGEFIIKI